MGKLNQKFKSSDGTPTHVLAISWNIATKPELYWKLSPNPYSPQALKIISKEFPGINADDIIRAVILAEPEGKYDREFIRMPEIRQKEELLREKDAAIEMNKRLARCLKKHSVYLKFFPRDTVYESLSKLVFGTPDIKEIEERYSQSQRRSFRLKIVDFIENKPMQKGLILSLSVAVLFLILIFFMTQQGLGVASNQDPLVNKPVLGAETQGENLGLPKHLEIPSIGVNAAVEYVGVAPGGIMGVPAETADVGWFDLGPRPGQKGSAVIAGHLDSADGSDAVFANLNKLKIGDKLYVTDGNENTIAFTVQGSREYAVGYADEVFSRNDGIYLNLVTCDGIWDGTKKSYTKRLVVFTEIAE